MSIRYKIAFLFAVIVTVILVIVSVSIYFFSAKERSATFNKRLRNRALSTAGVYAGNTGNDFSVLRKIDATTVSSLYNKGILIADNKGVNNYSFSDIAGDSVIMPDDVRNRMVDESEVFFSYGNKKAVAVHYTDERTDFIVAVAAVDTDGHEFLYDLKKILSLAVVLSILFCFLAGLIFAKTLIRPIKKITGEVNLITANNLSQRIKIKETNDELTRLATTFNNLLDRLQDSFAIQRRFISNASHELSTPLTSISSQLEVAMQKERSTAEYQELLMSIYEDCRELQALTHSLLDIAKSGTQDGIELASLRIDELLLKVVSEVQKQNKGYITTLEFNDTPDSEDSLTVFGNADLLYIALKNIVENGCKYADDMRSVIEVRFNKKYLEIMISNKGDVISESDILNIFQPFFRANSVKHKPGAGLGLTLAKRIILLHKGSIQVKSNPGDKTVFSISLPANTEYSN